MRWAKLFWLTAPVAALFTGINSYASDGDFGRYLGIRIIGAYAEIKDSSAVNFTGDLQINHDTDLVAGNSVILGYRWKLLPVRLEIEAGARYRFDYDLRDRGSQNGYENNLSTVIGLINGAYEFRNGTEFTPYLGGSIGWAQQNSDVERNDLRSGDSEEYINSESNFSWGAIIGVTWKFAQHWDADFGYRYIDLGAVNTGLSGVGTQIKAEDYISHDVLITINYRF